jgi:DNA uptake protein ComE-like DNA-binding protein
MTELQSFENWAKTNYRLSRPSFLQQQDDIVPSETDMAFNHWSVEEWMQVSGVGEKLAQRLMEATPFDSVEDIKRVKGISERVLGGVRELL